MRPCDVRITSFSALLKKKRKNPNNLSRHYINTGGLSCRHCARILVPSATCPQMCKWVENGSKPRNNITSTAASFVVLSYSEESRMKCQRRPRLRFDSAPCDAGQGFSNSSQVHQTVTHNLQYHFQCRKPRDQCFKHAASRCRRNQETLLVS